MITQFIGKYVQVHSPSGLWMGKLEQAEVQGSNILVKLSDAGPVILERFQDVKDVHGPLSRLQWEASSLGIERREMICVATAIVPIPGPSS